MKKEHDDKKVGKAARGLSSSGPSKSPLILYPACCKPALLSLAAFATWRKDEGEAFTVRGVKPRGRDHIRALHRGFCTAQSIWRSDVKHSNISSEQFWHWPQLLGDLTNKKSCSTESYICPKSLLCKSRTIELTNLWWWWAWARRQDGRQDLEYRVCTMCYNSLPFLLPCKCLHFVRAQWRSELYHSLSALGHHKGWIHAGLHPKDPLLLLLPSSCQVHYLPRPLWWHKRPRITLITASHQKARAQSDKD